MKRINRHKIAIAALAALVLPAAAGAQPADPERIAALVARIDTSDLGSMKGVRIPDGVAGGFDALAALDPNAAGKALTGESFEMGPATPQGVTAESAHWSYEWRPQRGAVLLHLLEGKQSPLPRVPGGKQALAQDTRARLAAIGVPAELIGPVAVRRLMTQSQSEDGGEPTEPRVAAHKVFVESSFVGDEQPVLVDGLRAVATYGVDRRLRKLLLYWPGLAEGGHEVESPLTPEEAALVVARDLVQSDEDDVRDRVDLEWVYAAVPAGPGEVSLDLRLQATLRDEPWAGGPHDVKPKIRVRQIDPDRFGAAFCHVETGEADYDLGEKAEVTSLRFANYTGASLPARLRLEVVDPSGGVAERLNRRMTMPDGMDRQFAAPDPIGLFAIDDLDPSLFGDYEVRCRVESLTTGAVLAADAHAFHASEGGDPE